MENKEVVKEVKNVKVETNNNVVKNPKLVVVPVIDKKTGELVKELNYYAERWNVSKIVGRSEPYYQLKLTTVNKDGNSMSISSNLTSEDVDYINFYRDNVLKKMRNNESQKMTVKTRCIYGTNDEGRFYAGVMLLIADEIRKVVWLSPSQLKILKATFENPAKAFSLVWEEVEKIEDVDTSDIQFL